MTNPILNGPIAPENNPPVEPQFYSPAKFIITALTLGRTTTVTMATTAFGVTNDFSIGQQVRFIIPPTYGTRQLNEQQGIVISIPTSNQVEVDIDSSINYDPFIASPTYGPTPPQILPIGDVNTGVINSSGRSSNGTYIPGSFINISPL